MPVIVQGYRLFGLECQRAVVLMEHLNFNGLGEENFLFLWIVTREMSCSLCHSEMYRLNWVRHDQVKLKADAEVPLQILPTQTTLLVYIKTHFRNEKAGFILPTEADDKIVNQNTFKAYRDLDLFTLESKETP